MIQSRFRARLVVQRLRRERETEGKRQEEMRILGEQAQQLKDLVSEITGLDQQLVEETRVREERLKIKDKNMNSGEMADICEEDPNEASPVDPVPQSAFLHFTSS
jgi:hypothetical protein